jgi:hypothetical protein
MKKTDLKSRTEDITPEEVLATEGLQHLNREQAAEVAEFIKTFSGIVYRLYEAETEKGEEGSILKMLGEGNSTSE